MCVCVCVCVYVRACVREGLRVSLLVCIMCVCAYIVCVFAHVYVCVCVYERATEKATKCLGNQTEQRTSFQ